jgi:nitrate/nitrite-specific signal transduction histidine kinase
MLELKIQCETAEDARIYLNAHQYHNLLDDLRNALRNAYKHGEGSSTALKVLENFYNDITKAVDHSQGPY